jgi:hypothetical protein
MREERFHDPVQVLILTITGLFFLVPGVVAVFIPLSWMEGFMQSTQPEQFNELWPSSPLFYYTLRAMGGFTAWMGVTFLIAASDPSRYKWWIFASGLALIGLAVICAASGFIYHLPFSIYLGDAIFSALGGILLLKSRPWKRE